MVLGKEDAGEKGFYHGWICGRKITERFLE
jgi:hypothetical protein